MTHLRLSTATVRMLAAHGDGEAQSALAGFRWATGGRADLERAEWRTFRSRISTADTPFNHVCIAYKGQALDAGGAT